MANQRNMGDLIRGSECLNYRQCQQRIANSPWTNDEYLQGITSHSLNADQNVAFLHHFAAGSHKGSNTT
jgi:hypothetical protein